MATASLTTSLAPPTPALGAELFACPRCERIIDAVNLEACRCCRAELCADCLGDDRFGWCLTCVGVLGDRRQSPLSRLWPFGVDADVTDADLVAKARRDIEDTAFAERLDESATVGTDAGRTRLERAGGHHV